MQWHPIFAALLRPLVQDSYDVTTNVPVGDLPREADVVLLRRLAAAAASFSGLWRHLTPWNVMEFKGPTVDARLRDLGSLVEVGLGIDRRFNEERQRQHQPLLPAGDVSFWYLVNHLGQRFLPEAQRMLHNLEQLGNGLWRCVILDHPLFLVSIDDLPVERDSVPLHLLSREPAERERAVAQLVIQQQGFWELYGGWLSILHPNLWEEIQKMARENGIEPTIDLRPLIKMVGIEQVIEQMGFEQLAAKVNPNQFVAHLTSDQRREWLKCLQQPEETTSPPDTPAE